MVRGPLLAALMVGWWAAGMPATAHAELSLGDTLRAAIEEAAKATEPPPARAVPDPQPVPAAPAQPSASLRTPSASPAPSAAALPDPATPAPLPAPAQSPTPLVARPVAPPAKPPHIAARAAPPTHAEDRAFARETEPATPSRKTARSIPAPKREAAAESPAPPPKRSRSAHTAQQPAAAKPRTNTARRENRTEPSRAVHAKADAAARATPELVATRPADSTEIRTKNAAMPEAARTGGGTAKALPRAGAPKLAALTPPKSNTGPAGQEPALTLNFAQGSDALSTPSAEALQRFAEAFAMREGRLEILAYADVPDGSLAAARRLSLKRALAVREVLINKGIRSTRIDVRALGGADAEGDPNRLDLVIESGPNGDPAYDGATDGG